MENQNLKLGKQILERMHARNPREGNGLLYIYIDWP